MHYRNTEKTKKYIRGVFNFVTANDLQETSILQR